MVLRKHQILVDLKPLGKGLPIRVSASEGPATAGFEGTLQADAP